MAYKQNAGRDNLTNLNIAALTNGGTDPETDPKEKEKPKGTSTTTTTSVKGIDPNNPDSRRKGTIFTDTVTTVYDGTTGNQKPGKPTGPTQPFNNPALPNQTYKEFIDAPPGSPGKPVKTPNTPGRTSVTSSTRFLPDPLSSVTLKPYGPDHSFQMPKGNIAGAKPISTGPKISQYYHHTGSNAHNMKFGGHTTTSNTTNPNGNFSASYTKSPGNTISGKSNTTSSVPFTQAQNMAVHAGYRIGQNAPPSDEVANAFVARQTEKVQKRALAKYNKRYNK